MIALEVKFDKDYPAVIQSFVDRHPRVIDKEVRAVCSEATEGVLRAEPVNTGHLRRKTTLKRIRDLVYRIVADTKYAAHLEFGTRPHKIAARNANALVFMMGNKKIIVPKNPRKIPPWMIDSGLIGGDLAGKKKKKGLFSALEGEDEQIVWSMKGYVDHPGIKPFRFLRNQIPFITSELPVRIAASIKKMFDEVFKK